MVWSGCAVLMSGKTDSIKLNNNLGCLPGSTFVYNEVFKLDFSSASSLFHLMYDNCELTLLDEFTSELTLPHSIPPGIDDVNLDPEGDIFDSLMEEIDIFLDGDGSIPSGIESDDYDSEDDDNSTSRPEFESFHVDYPDSGDSTPHLFFKTFQQQYLVENLRGAAEAFQCQPLNYYEPNPCYDSNYSGYDQFDNFHPQQFLCCENYGGPHETYQCQPMNEDYYHEQNSCYDPNSFGFDQFQPPQYTVNHPLFNDQNDLLNSQNELFNSQNKLMEQLTSMRDMVGQYIQKKEEEKRIEEEQAAKARYWKILVCYDDDDDEESSTPLKDIIMSGLPPCVAITPDSPKTDSLIMEDEHLTLFQKWNRTNS
ncbi:hypothetical protein Tco_0711639 [Tanacetum coccineum]